MNAATASKPGRIYTIHSMDEQEIDTRVRGVAALSEKEARTLTEQIQRTTARLWLLVTEAHDRKAHLALGYETWAAYTKVELNMSESRSYQLLDTGHVMKALAAGGVNVEMTNPPPARVVALVKDRLTDVRKAAEVATRKGDSIDKAIRDLARESKAPTSGAAASSSAASSSTAENVVTLPAKGGKTGTGSTPCPACAGSGKVTKTVAERLLTLIQKL